MQPMYSTESTAGPRPQFDMGESCRRVVEQVNEEMTDFQTGRLRTGSVVLSIGCLR